MNESPGVAIKWAAEYRLILGVIALNSLICAWLVLFARHRWY
jgi:hypothetical protein